MPIIQKLALVVILVLINVGCSKEKNRAPSSIGVTPVDRMKMSTSKFNFYHPNPSMILPKRTDS